MTNVTNIADAPTSKQEKLDKYCEGIANGLSKQAAYVAAGYSELGSRTNAQKYHRMNGEYIAAFLSEHIGSHVPTALKVVLEVMSDPNEKGGIRLKAAQDILDRGGYGAKQRIELTTTDVKDLSTKELQDEINKLVAENPNLVAIFNPSKSVGE